MSTKAKVTIEFEDSQREDLVLAFDDLKFSQNRPVTVMYIDGVRKLVPDEEITTTIMGRSSVSSGDAK